MFLILKTQQLGLKRSGVEVLYEIIIKNNVYVK